MIPGSWQHRMKLQLSFKASKAYYILSDAATNLLKNSRALRYIKLALQCHCQCLLSGSPKHAVVNCGLMDNMPTVL
ncbi:erythroid differentiation-related factor 1-like [Salvelinus namaycush]|uniref:Erythroid differentiation-related factor 1-like n=1 Tax=Salvelinus namaycush TaxID=8040 RepID=A0A8U0UBU2_SALNM|nr:erythroid differentiation-related factor 1-like [Salvelinus namaycush]